MSMRITPLVTVMGESGSLLTAGTSYTVSDSFGAAMVGRKQATDVDGVLTPRFSGPVTTVTEPLTGGVSLFSGTTRIKAETLTPGLSGLQRRPGVISLPATTSTAANGWGVAGGAVLSQVTGAFGAGVGTRVTASNGGASDSFIYLRRRIVADLNPATGKVEIPVFMPFAMGVGATLQVTVSSDVSGANPPNATPTNRKSFTFQPTMFKRGQWQVLGVDFSSTATSTPDFSNAAVVSSSGTPDITAILQVELYFYVPAGAAPYFDIGDISFGARSTPHVMLCFDGAGSDMSHFAYVVPLLEKYGFKAAFSAQGQIITSYAASLRRLYLAGHDLTNEGLNHTNYGSSPTLLLGDAATAKATLDSLGFTRGSNIFTAANNSLAAVGSANAGVKELLAAGYKFIRHGNRWSIPVSAAGVEDLNFGPFLTGALTATTFGNYLDSLELHGESGMFLFHGITTGAATGTQVNLTEFTTFIADLATRVSQRRMIQVSPSEFVQVFNS